MFDIGFLELVIVSVVGLLVLGPERLPVAIRTVTLYVNKIRNSVASVRADIERELKADEIRQELHNQSVMQELRKAERSIRESVEKETGMKLGKDGYPVGTSMEELTAATVRSGPAKKAATPIEEASAESQTSEEHDASVTTPASDGEAANVDAADTDFDSENAEPSATPTPSIADETVHDAATASADEAQKSGAS